MNINIKGTSITSKPRKDGRYQGHFSDGKDKQYVYGRSYQEVEKKLQKLVKTGIKKKRTTNIIPTDFDGFSKYYFETFRKRKIAPTTYTADLRRYDRYLKNKFGKRSLKSITPKECQDILDRINATGKGKTADEIFSLLSVIFKAAIKHGIIARNPLDIVFHKQHERVNGKVLKIADIKRLMTSNSKFLPLFLIALYTGLRPNECEKFEIDGDFIKAVNSKRKNGKVEYKRIPIMHELKPFLTGDFAKVPQYESLRIEFKRVLPEFTLKDLRKTFNSRCIECGVNEIARKIWMGHSLGVLGQAYTELSDEFFLKEAQKFYFLPKIDTFFDTKRKP